MPSVMANEILPSVPPLQSVATPVAVSDSGAGSFSVILAVAVQAFASLTTMSYVPAPSPV